VSLNKKEKNMGIATRILTAAAVLCTLGAPAFAAVTLQTNETAFLAAGNITQSTNFDAYGSGFSFLGNPHTVGALTFTSGNNLVVGTATGYGNSRNLLAFNGWSPMSGTVAGQNDLFGFKLTLLGTASPVTATLQTNLGSYVFSGLVPAANPGLSFYGFQAGAGEYFTGFTLASAQGTGSAPSTTDFVLGTAGGVPEPATWAMLIAGFGLVGAAARRRGVAAVSG
jgi:hypothetical protein